jgi:hypothetical protein
MTLILLLLCSHFGQSQTTSSVSDTHFFAQCKLTMSNQAAFDSLQLDLASNPYVSVVRVDFYSKRLFLLTKNITSYTEPQFLSWLGAYMTNATCIQIGVHGVDAVKPYPFTDCETN